MPILVSGDVFSLSSLPYTSPYLAPRDGDEGRPHLPKLRGMMAARALLANPALFAGYERCPWEAVEAFMVRVVRAPLPLKLVLHHCEFCPTYVSALRLETILLTGVCANGSERDVLAWIWA